jgi:hypothetical protein
MLRFFRQEEAGEIEVVLQDPNQNNVHNPNSVRREESKHFRHKREGVS